MFGRKKLNNRIESLEIKVNRLFEDASGRISKLEQDIIDLRNDLEHTLGKLQNDVEARLIEFHKEIADKYFESLENIFRFNKEISLINQLAQGVTEKDIAQLKTALLEPALQKRWEAEKAQVGIKIMDMRKSLHDEILKMERENQSADKIASLKVKLNRIDQVLEEAK